MPNNLGAKDALKSRSAAERNGHSWVRLSFYDYRFPEAETIIWAPIPRRSNKWFWGVMKRLLQYRDKLEVLDVE